MSDNHFIRNFESQAGAFTVYMALVLVGGDITKPPITKQQVTIKWLQDETRFQRKKIMDAIRFLKQKEVLFTEERMDVIYYRFTVESHNEISKRVFSINKSVKTTSIVLANRDLITKYFRYLMDFSRTKGVNVKECLVKIRLLLKDFEERKLSPVEIEHYFQTLAHKLSEGADMLALLSPTVLKKEDALTKVPTKVVGWSD